MSQLTPEEVRHTAQVATAALTAAGFPCCLVGSAAGSEYGISRTPNDVDILVLTSSQTPAELKQLLIEQDDRFTLEKPAEKPHAAYFVLWYSISVPQSKFCRVDIFQPGMIHLPEIPETRIFHSAKTDLPVMPLLPVLLHKLHAWIAHRDSPKEHSRIKQANDVQDIKDLLDAACVIHKIDFADNSWLPSWFLTESEEALSQYIVVHPETISAWRSMGFELKDVA